MSITTPRGMGIGAISQSSGVKVETIRYYERIGLLPAPMRTAGGNRQFDGRHEERLFFIRRCRNLGFGIEEIRALLDMADRPTTACADIHAATTAHVKAIRRRIADLKRMERTLARIAAECGKDDGPSCPIVELLFDRPVA